MFDDKTLLIADDELYLRESLAAFFKLRKAFKEIYFAATPKEASAVILANKPDITLLDIGQGDALEGMDILKEAKKILPAKCKIVMISGYREYKDECFEIGADGYVKKPFALPELILFIAEVLKDQDAGSAGRKAQTPK
ncbi:MAG: response regulator [Candidatus Omnitrophica bacterium]|nr:response regulator [Candidatus Omnitrophota bacterium]